jgi:cyanophycinase-like exopeptidase
MYARIARPAALAIAALLLVAVSIATMPLDATAKGGGKVSRIRLGSPDDVTPTLIGPSYFLQGNGAPLANAFQVHINQVASAPLDVVILAASFPSSGSQTPECDTIITLNNVNSCETVTIPKTSLANDPGATEAINDAEIVYFAGGNQCNYVGWKGSTVYNAAKNVVARGGGMGGGSAGLAIQGEYVYDGCAGSVLSSEALSNPYHRYISFTYDYFNWQNLEQIITDSHLVERDRIGRLMAFVARQIQDGKTTAAYGVGIDTGSVFVIDKNGLGALYGNVAYVVLGDHTPENCTSGQPLTFSNYKIWKVTAGGAYNFANRPTTGYYLRSVTDGVISSDPYNP